ncbi:LPS translocon maturation chaperone LptM [Pseudidiomarina sp. CB1]|nr:lipoprotein [Pseudidiomarina sp. CB1]
MRPIIVAASLVLVACGQKGPLEMPPPAEQNKPAEPVTDSQVQDSNVTS